MASLKFPLNGEWVKLKVYAIVDALHTRLESTKFPNITTVLGALENLADNKYSKPSSGIPKADLASDVQSSLSAADTALQEVPSEYVTNTDYATSSVGGVTKVNPSYGIRLSNQGALYALSSQYSAYINYADNAFISKGTLENVISGEHLDRPEVRSTLDTTLVVNNIYDLGVQTSLTLNLPATGQLGDWLEVDFLSGATATNLTVTSSAGMTDFDLTPSANSIFAIYANWQRIDMVDSTAVYGWAISYAENKRMVSE